jgi:hypothetical protein
VEYWGGERAESCENGENMRKYITRRKEGVCKETESMEDGENRMLEIGERMERKWDGRWRP